MIFDDLTRKAENSHIFNLTWLNFASGFKRVKQQTHCFLANHRMYCVWFCGKYTKQKWGDDLPNFGNYFMLQTFLFNLSHLGWENMFNTLNAITCVLHHY